MFSTRGPREGVTVQGGPEKGSQYKGAQNRGLR